MIAALLSLLNSPTILAILGGIVIAIGALFKGRIDGAAVSLFGAVAGRSSDRVQRGMGEGDC